MKKKIGFFGGTFDPIHYGHIHLAICLKEICHLDEVIFSPAFLSPFKRKTPPEASSVQRLDMVRLAIENIPGIFLDSGEIMEEKISFTIDALRRVKKRFANTEWHLLLSDEEVPRLMEWKEIEEVLQIAPPWIGGRFERFPKGSLAERLKKSFVEIPKIEISSTLVRKRLKKGLYCGHLLNEKVLDYIGQNKLYSNVNRK
jgi:nicotinate-nucleotide adenylyltransferase